MAEFINTSDSLNDGRKKINNSIRQSERAEDKSNQAVKTSNEAKQTSEEANDKTDYIQTQLDTVTAEGTIDPAVEQLKVGSDGQTYPSPDARIRTEHEKVTSQLAQTGVDAKIGRGSSQGGADIVLDIPTYDGYPTATHPDVVYIPKGWNGYTHWMAFTPYPAGDRENPSIIASNNGVDWEVPDGLTNPLKTNADAYSLNFTFWSDTDLILLPDNRLAVYFRGHRASTGHEGIYRMTSSDGVHWEEFTLVLEEFSERGDVILSPAIVVEEDGTFSMFSINHEKVGTEKMEKRTSNDGINWSSPIQCSIPSGYDAWHVDVVKVHGYYHALISSDYSGANGRLYYSKSKDGFEFEGDDKPAVPLSGYVQDSHGHYRSSLVPVAGNPLSFKVYVASYYNAISPTSEGWRILYYDDVVFENNTFRSLKRIDDLVKESDTIYIPATEFEVTLGSLEKGYTGVGNIYWNLPTGTSQLVAQLSIPKDWNVIRFYAVLANLQGEPGAVRLGLQIGYRLPEESISENFHLGAGSIAHTIDLPSSDKIVKGFVGGQGLQYISGQRYMNKNSLNYVRVSRSNVDLNTFTGDLAFMGVILERLEDDARGVNTPPS